MKPKPILLAEDSDGDLILMGLAYKLARIPNRLIAVGDGQEAVDYLQGKSKFADRKRYPLPCLLITDLNMPRMNGLELLQWLNEHPEFADIPRVMLSSSADESERRRARELGARVYFEKPSGIHQLVGLLQQLDADWLSRHCAAPRQVARNLKRV